VGAEEHVLLQTPRETNQRKVRAGEKERNGFVEKREKGKRKKHTEKKKKFQRGETQSKKERNCHKEKRERYRQGGGNQNFSEGGKKVRVSERERNGCE